MSSFRILLFCYVFLLNFDLLFLSVVMQSRNLTNDNCTLLECLDLFTQQETLVGDDRPVCDIHT